MVTIFYAGILALFFIVLSVLVVAGRFKNRVSLGDGGNVDMTKRIRAHGNFAEYVPFALLLMFLVEIDGMRAFIIHIIGSTLIIGRLFHANAFYEILPIPMGRVVGMILTFLVIGVAALIGLASYLF